MVELLDWIGWLCEFVLLPLIVIYLYNLYSFIKSFDNLCDEIDLNYSKMQETKLREQFTRMRNIWNKNIENPHQFEWVGFAKIISIWTLSEKNDTIGTDYYRYLSNNELKNFIRQGYYRFIKDIEEDLTLFYLECEDLSIKEQNIEKTINREITNFYSESFENQKEYLDTKIRSIEVLIHIYQDSFLMRYNKIHPFFKKNLFHKIKLYMWETSDCKNKVILNINRCQFFATVIFLTIGLLVIVNLIAAFIVILYQKIPFLAFLIIVLGLLVITYKIINHYSEISKKTVNLIRSYPENGSDSSHHAIIIAYKRKPDPKSGRTHWSESYLSGEDILIEMFRSFPKQINYKVYEVKSKEEVIPVILDEKTTHLWIFGHGQSNKLAFEEGALCYREVSQAPKKVFIGQYHCNSILGKSLGDYNQPLIQDITHWSRIDPLIRWAVKKKLSELELKKLL